VIIILEPKDAEKSKFRVSWLLYQNRRGFQTELQKEGVKMQSILEKCCTDWIEPVQNMISGGLLLTGDKPSCSIKGNISGSVE
jgi:hypothetical protein